MWFLRNFLISIPVIFAQSLLGRNFYFALVAKFLFGFFVANLMPIGSLLKISQIKTWSKNRMKLLAPLERA